ncbi:hypothetical protein BGW41_006872 [Actinomortierella wolfii]|nr:hypothetical protein BGW41_006872 [Actinomortierella wolfii]
MPSVEVHPPQHEGSTGPSNTPGHHNQQQHQYGHQQFPSSPSVYGSQKNHHLLHPAQSPSSGTLQHHQAKHEAFVGQHHQPMTKSNKAQKKALTIHIDTPHVGPNGMPLVYGSSPAGPGKIKGWVRFSANYDCKGKDILIIYEARAEASWSTIENKKMVHHHTREDFGYQTWTLPLKHTKEGGSTIIAGDYEKAFEVLLAKPSPPSPPSPTNLTSARSSTSSLTTTVTSSVPRSPASHTPSGGQGATTAAGPVSPTTTLCRDPLDTSSSAAVFKTRAATALPSSSYGIHARMRYTIRAILQRPFPSSNVEASQEIWVLHTSLPSIPASPPKAPLVIIPSTESKKRQPSSGSASHRRTNSLAKTSEGGAGREVLESASSDGVVLASQTTTTNTTSSSADFSENSAKPSSKDSEKAVAGEPSSSLQENTNKSPSEGGGLGNVLTSVNVFRYIPTSLPAVDTIKKKIGTSIDKAEQLLMFSSSKLSSAPTPATPDESPSSSSSSSDESSTKDAGQLTATATTVTASVASSSSSSSSSSEKEDMNAATTAAVRANNVDGTLGKSGDSRRHSMQPPSPPAVQAVKAKEQSIHRSTSLPSTRGLQGNDPLDKDRKSVLLSLRRGSNDKGQPHRMDTLHDRRLKDKERNKKKKKAPLTDIEYTGLWEVFQMPYCLSLPSETVYLGQRVPLRIRFGPFPWAAKEHASDSSDSSDSSPSESSLAYRRKQRGMTRRSAKDRRMSTSSSSSSLDGTDSYMQQPRFRVTRGTLKLVEHILLRKVDHIEVLQRQRMPSASRHYQQASENHAGSTTAVANPSSSRQRQQVSITNTGDSSNTAAGASPQLIGGTGGRFSIRRLVQRHNHSGNNNNHRHSEYLERLHDEGHHLYTQGSNSNQYLSVRDSRAAVGPAATASSSPVSANFPHHHNHNLLHPQETNASAAKSSGFGLRLWPMAKKTIIREDKKAGRHSVDFGDLSHQQGDRNTSTDALHQLQNLQPVQGHPMSSSVPAGRSSGASTKPMTTKVISQVEARFKTEVMTLPLDMFLTQAGTKDGPVLLGENESVKKNNRHLEGEDKEQELEQEGRQDYWETIVWFTIPDPSKVSPYTQTTNIVKSHTLQLILGCSLEVPASSRSRDDDDSDESNSDDDVHPPSSLPVSLQHLAARPGAVITKPFRLELDLYLTGPPVPSC